MPPSPSLRRPPSPHLFAEGRQSESCLPTLASAGDDNTSPPPAPEADLHHHPGLSYPLTSATSSHPLTKLSTIRLTSTRGPPPRPPRREGAGPPRSPPSLWSPSSSPPPAPSASCIVGVMWQHRTPRIRDQMRWDSTREGEREGRGGEVKLEAKLPSNPSRVLMLRLGHHRG